MYIPSGGKNSSRPCHWKINFSLSHFSSEKSAHALAKVRRGWSNIAKCIFHVNQSKDNNSSMRQIIVNQHFWRIGLLYHNLLVFILLLWKREMTSDHKWQFISNFILEKCFSFFFWVFHSSSILLYWRASKHPFHRAFKNKQERSTEGALGDCPKNHRVWVVVDRLGRFAWLVGSSFRLQPNDRPQHRQVYASFFFSWNIRVSRSCLKITATPEDGILFTATRYKANDTTTPTTPRIPCLLLHRRSISCHNSNLFNYSTH